MYEKKIKIPIEVDKDTFYSRIMGKKFHVHDLEFEVYSKRNDRGEVKIIPHAENVNRTTTLPITLVTVNETSDPPYVLAHYHMRSIDIGLPKFLTIFFAGMFIIGVIAYFSSVGFRSTGLIFAGISIVGFLIMLLKLNKGYYDYIRKIHHWLEAQAM